MRLIASLLLGTLYCISALAATIKPVVIDGKTLYMLEAGTFPNENSALQLKFKLSSQFKQKVSIDFLEQNKQYLVKLGPLKGLKLAESIQNQLSANAPTEPPVVSEEQTNDPSDKTNKKLWNLRNADIRAVIDEVSRVTGINFVIDPRVQGKISIVSATPMTDKEVYQVFLSVLQVSGYAAIPSGAITKIIPNIDAKTISSDMMHELRHPPRGDEMLVEVIPVQFVPAEQLVPALRPLMPQWSNVSAYAPSNMLILSGRASNIKKLASIIKQVDSPNANGIDTVPLRHALAMDVVNTLKDIIKAQGPVSGRSQPMIAADDRGNSILLSGSRTERLRLRLLIEKLDRNSPNSSNGNTQVVYLHYLRAEDLAPILAGIAQANFSGTVGTTIGTITRPALDSTNPASNLVTLNGNNSTTQSAATQQSAAANAANPAATPGTSGAPTQNEGSTKPSVQIIAEPNTNSIILNAPASLIRILRSVIDKLDILPAQLLIEALVAEINETVIKDLGIEWGSNQQTRLASNFKAGFAIINSKTSIDDFQAQIYALARQNKANILSTPSVMVLDNRQAKILVGRQVSVSASTYPNNANGTALGSPFTTFERVNVALHLYVRPQITKGKGIQLQIDQGNDTIDPASTTNTTNPIFRISAIVTSVQVESGDIVVLGGLNQDSLGNDDNRIPILGDIPGIGRLFQRNIRNREKRVLMVFIRPLIIRNERESVLVSGEKYNDIRQYQLDWLRSQEYNDRNNDMLLPPLQQDKLPRPFVEPVMATK